MPLVDPYNERYIDEKGNVIGVRYDGPVGDMRRTEYNLGVGGAERVHSNPFGDKYSVITPPGSTEQGGMDILTPPGSTQQGGLEPITPPDKQDKNSDFKDIFADLFMKTIMKEMEERERR